MKIFFDAAFKGEHTTITSRTNMTQVVPRNLHPTQGVQLAWSVAAIPLVASFN